MKELKVKIKNLVENQPVNAEAYSDLLDDLGCSCMHYWDFTHNKEGESVSIDSEMNYLNEEGYQFACALLTAILREDHFSNGSLKERQENGDLIAILTRILELIDEK